MAGLALIQPEWPAPATVRSLATTRQGGVSAAPWDSLNLGLHVEDEPTAVAANRQRLREAGGLPAEPGWLTQVHGTHIVDPADAAGTPEADGACTAQSGVVCAVLTADCLPVLICDRQGRRVAAVHAGWRGLAAGILDAALMRFAQAGIGAAELLVWLGPAIGGPAYEVGSEVREAFAEPGDAAAFARNPAGRWQLSLETLARARLAVAGVTGIYGGGLCTHAEPERFFSYRRDGACGRQATLIWLAGASTH